MDTTKDNNRIIKFLGFLQTAYFPNLISTKDGTPYASRPVNMIPMDVEDAPVARLELWKSRIMDAIHTGFVLDVSN